MDIPDDDILLPTRKGGGDYLSSISGSSSSDDDEDVVEVINVRYRTFVPMDVYRSISKHSDLLNL